MMKVFTRCAALLAATGLTACTIQETEIPPLTGPSELGLSVSVAAVPDLIIRNGFDQAIIVVTARNPDGSGAAGVQFRADTQVGSFFQEFGTLSSRFLTTGSDGRGTILYTAPPAPPSGTSSVIDRVTIVVSRIGTNQQTALFHSVQIRLVPPSVSTPGSPIAFFSYSPSAVATNTQVIFNAGSSYAVTGSTIVNYAWDWGDGTTDLINPSPAEDHDWAAPGVYNVTLTVTDDLGQKGSTTQTITVS
jgi:PKD repeat protein